MPPPTTTTIAKQPPAGTLAIGPQSRSSEVSRTCPLLYTRPGRRKVVVTLNRVQFTFSGSSFRFRNEPNLTTAQRRQHVRGWYYYNRPETAARTIHTRYAITRPLPPTHTCACTRPSSITRGTRSDEFTRSTYILGYGFYNSFHFISRDDFNGLRSFAHCVRTTTAFTSRRQTFPFSSVRPAVRVFLVTPSRNPSRLPSRFNEHTSNGPYLII